MELKEITKEFENFFGEQLEGNTYQETQKLYKKLAKKIHQTQTKEIEELKETIKNQDMTINFLTSKW